MKNSVWAVMMVKNEEDIIGYTLKHLVGSGIHGIVIADNESTDSTLEIINDVKRSSNIPITMVRDSEKAYLQSEKMTRYSTIAHDMGADIILPTDADELIQLVDSNSKEKPIAKLVEEVNNCGCDIVGMPWRWHYPSAVDIRNDNPYLSMVYAAKEPYKAVSKIAFRYHPEYTVDMGNHNITHSNGDHPYGLMIASLEIRHFPYRTIKQYRKKIIQIGEAFEEAGDKLPSDAGAHWKEVYSKYKKHGIKAIDQEFILKHYRQYPKHSLEYNPAKYLGE
jgi:glycosyltransferase involved in cell wall biosynthesis